MASLPQPFHPPPVLTQRQIERLDRLPPNHRVVAAHDGMPIVQRPDGQMLSLKPNGRLAATTLISRVQDYMHAFD